VNGDFIRKKIEIAGFQLSEVARNMNISQQDLQSKLKSKDIKVSFMENVAKAINKSVYYFFDSKDEKNLTVENSKENGKENGKNSNVKETLPFENDLSFQSGDNGDFNRIMQKIKFAEKVSISDHGAPFYDLPVSAGMVEELLEASELPSGFISMPGVNCDAYFPITGCSFKDYIEAGDIIGVNFLNNWEILDPDCIYLIVTNDQRMLKRLVKHPTDTTLLICVSPNYREFTIDKFTIRYIMKVTFRGKPI